MAIGDSFGAVMQSDIGIPGGVASYDENQAALAAKLPVHGMGKNLLRNWYFVGGGSQQGGGQFPINSREQTEYTGIGRKIDAWYCSYTNGTYSVSLQEHGLVFSSSAISDINQRVETSFSDLAGKAVTCSILYGNQLFQATAIIDNEKPTSQKSYINENIIDNTYLKFDYSTSLNSFIFYIVFNAIVNFNLKAVKLELGDTQTLAHQDEDGNWVLNEIPGYEEELIRCQTSKADSADAYANKDLATQQQLATVEQTGTASRAYAVGDYLCYNGLLYRVTVAISAGGAITPGTNVVSTTVGEELISPPRSQTERVLIISANSSETYVATKTGYLSVFASAGTAQVTFDITIRDSLIPQYGASASYNLAAYSSEPLITLPIVRGRSYAINNRSTKEVLVYEFGHV